MGSWEQIECSGLCSDDTWSWAGEPSYLSYETNGSIVPQEYMNKNRFIDTDSEFGGQGSFYQ